MKFRFSQESGKNELFFQESGKNELFFQETYQSQNFRYETLKSLVLKKTKCVPFHLKVTYD